MAKCKYKLPEDFMQKLSSLGKRMDEVSEAVLQAGGAVVYEQTKKNLDKKLSGDSTGELAAALGLSGVRLDKKGNHNIKLGFSEPRKDGSSNAMVANILEYGKFNQPPRPFLKPAKSKTKKPCVQAMVDKLEEEIKKS